MATQIEDLTEEQSDDVVTIDNDTAEVVDDTANDNEGGQQQDDEADVVSWGSSQVEVVEESEGMRNLRARLKELDRENRQLKGQTKADDVGPEPDMEEYWDKPEQYKTDLLAWNERKRKAEEREASAEVAARKQQERWEAQSRDMESGYAELRVAGKDAARATVEDTFPGEQFAYLVKAAGKNAPAFILALGNAADKRAELASLAADGSWAEFIATAAIMSKEVNVQRRRPATSPEENRSAGGASGAGVGAGSRTLERLEAQARKSGNWTEVLAYKRKLNNG